MVVGPEQPLVEGLADNIRTIGVPVSVLSSFAPPPLDDDEQVRDRVQTTVSSVLALAGVDADPVKSREHILLSNLVLNEWSAGRNLDLPSLVGMVQSPPLRKLGVFELDQFFPPKDRTAFAMRLNGLLASPAFGAWMSGIPLNIDTMLRTADGKPDISGMWFSSSKYNANLAADLKDGAPFTPTFDAIVPRSHVTVPSV